MIGLFMARRTLTRLDAINRLAGKALRGNLAGPGPIDRQR